MQVVIFGATGMVGRGVFMEALNSPHVTSVISVSRRPSGETHDKLKEVLLDDLFEIATVKDQLGKPDACFWCLGVSSAGMREEAYTRVTHTLTLAAADVLKALNEEMTFCFLSGSGADGRAMWARVKKKAEDDLTALFPRVIVFRPAYIRADHGAKPRGALIQTAYAVFSLAGPLIRALGGGTSNSEVGRAMIHAAKDKPASAVLTSSDINVWAARLS